MNHYYQDIPGWFDFEDVYRDVARDAPNGATLVEIGCYEGRSLSFLLVEALNSSKKLLVIGVDHFQGGEEQWMRDDATSRSIKDICLKNCLRAGTPDFLLLAEPSVDAAKRFPDGSVWFVFIDGSHDPDSVRTDLDAWVPKIAPGGRIAGHDWGCHGVTDTVTARFGNRVIVRSPSSWEVQL